MKKMALCLFLVTGLGAAPAGAHGVEKHYSEGVMLAEASGAQHEGKRTFSSFKPRKSSPLTAEAARKLTQNR